MQLTDSHRPKTLSEIVGNEKAKGVLAALLAHPFPSAWLLEGPSGVGKTSVARIIAQELARNVMDWHQFQGGQIDQRTADWIRDLAQQLPWNGGFKVFVLDEADRMTEGAQIAFLDILENLGPQTIFLLTSNERGDFEPRFLSRLKVVHFTTQGLAEAGADLLVSIARENGLELDRQSAKKRMQRSHNNIRSAIQDLEVELMLVRDFAA